ncbi:MULTISPECIES: DUF4233 domain-containing protein [Kitasatospora]|uniref:DUF4233 domain-containing protein n=1 Tax=Kitasatospora setae (strain ATCC 33774 / DSM 43861 / JCM 3304 / KCC A-0304 / NBRC 14216 / KM-6054) TaxID=452652 RepID=E4NB49_KITSK|nr:MULTISPECIES: DUF4233 domain-containing protein [Kitasatospora]BAJ28430.1 hypothetical protein KSE_26180 [Kitasatospora setae KM-6054]
MRILCSSTLIGEALLIMFAGLVAMKLTDVGAGTIWTVSAVAMVLCVLLCGVITRPGAVYVGWALQVAVLASGLVLPTMYAFGLVFGGLWWCSVHYGRRIDEIKARRAAAEESAPAVPATA